MLANTPIAYTRLSGFNFWLFYWILASCYQDRPYDRSSVIKCLDHCNQHGRPGLGSWFLTFSSLGSSDSKHTVREWTDDLECCFFYSHACTLTVTPFLFFYYLHVLCCLLLLMHMLSGNLTLFWNFGKWQDLQI